MRKILWLILTVACVIAVDAGARKVKMHTHKDGTLKTNGSYGTDTLRCCTTDSVTFSGYDKPAMSDRETFFTTNRHASDTIRRMEIEIEYTQTDGRQLHRRIIQTDCEIPPGQTRLIDVRSWDRQHSFRYRLSREGRSAATEYDVHLRLKRCWCHPQR